MSNESVRQMYDFSMANYKRELDSAARNDSDTVFHLASAFSSAVSALHHAMNIDGGTGIDRRNQAGAVLAEITSVLRKIPSPTPQLRNRALIGCTCARDEMHAGECNGDNCTCHG